MLFYVPPLLPVMASLAKVNHDERGQNLNPIAKHWTDNWLYDTSTEELWGSIDQARFPLKYMANLFTIGNEQKIADPLKKLMAVRIYRRWKTVGDISEERAMKALSDTGLTPDMAEEHLLLTSLAKVQDRFVIPAAHREHAIEMLENTGDAKGSIGFGTLNPPRRGT